VVIGHQEEALVLAAVLQFEVFFERADVVAEVVLACWTQAGQQSLLAGLRNGAVGALLGHGDSTEGIACKRPLPVKDERP
jgi:hypothetical protein